MTQATKARSNLTSADLDAFTAQLKQMERAGEITMDEFMALSEDIAVIGRSYSHVS
jgi:tape measure domain-containing protein